MAKNCEGTEVLGTIWQVPDELWTRVQRVLLELDPPAAVGRKRVDQRKALDGIIFRLRSGCQWNQLPRQYGDDSSVHRTFQRWQARGVFERIWAVLAEACQELGGVDWDWQAADSSMGKARLGGI
jgi:putative transposase